MSMDEDQSGTIDQREFEAGLRDRSIELDREAYRDLFDAVDLDHSQVVTMDEV